MKRISSKDANRLELNHLEGYLERTLEPVIPRVEFVNTLRDKLNRAELHAEENILEKEPRALHYALLGGAGILSSLLLLITGIRAMVALMGAIGALRQMRKRLEVKTPMPVTAPTTAQ
jgi:hypothetical protein